MKKYLIYLAVLAVVFPVAERLAACVLSLPMHTELDEEQLEYITKHVNKFTNYDL